MLAALVVLLPLVYDPWGWQAYLPVKWAVVAPLAALGVAVLSTVPRDRQTIVGVGFLVLGIVVGIDALDPLAHWIGTPERGLGWIAFLFFFLCFLIGGDVEADARRLVTRAATMALMGVGVHGTLQMMGLIGDDTVRVTATMGSAAYLGAVVCLLLPVTLGTMLDPDEAIVWRIVAGVAGALGVVVALGSQTRAAWVGLGIAAVVVVIGGLRRKMMGVVVLVALGLVVAFSPLGDRFSQLAAGDVIGRIEEWRTAVSVFATDPLTGVGFEGYRIAFPTEVTEDYVREFNREVVTDRAHNGALDVGTSTGALGLITYLGAMIWVLWLGWRAIRSERALMVGLGAALIAYIVQQQFLFPVLEVDPIFWGLVGMVSTSLRTPTRRQVPRPVKWVAIPVALVLLVVGTLGVIADRNAATALELAAAGEGARALEEVHQAGALRPDSFLYPLVEAEVLLTADEPQSAEALVGAIDGALALAPRDPILRQRRAEVMLRLSTQGLMAPAENLEYYRSILERDPHNPTLLLGAGQAALNADDVETAEGWWLRAANLDPDNAQPLLALADLYQQTDRPEAAELMRSQAQALTADPE